MAIPRALDRAIGWLGPDRTLAERAGLFAAAAVVGPSFEPGLQPRGTVHQALATGVISATTLGLVTAAQSTLASIGRILTRDRTDATSATARVALNVLGNASAAVACIGVAYALPPREDESFRRGLVRTVADRTGRVAVVTTGLAVVAGSSSLVSLARPQSGWIKRLPVTFTAGVVAAAWGIHRARTRARQAGDSTIDSVSPGRSVALAVGVGAGVLGLQAGQHFVANGVEVIVRRTAPSLEPLASPIGNLVSLGLLGGALLGAYEYAVRHVEQGGAAVEPAYESPPTSPFVSGGPGSVVSFESLSREGRRFSNMALTRGEIEEVMGEPAVADPVRIFVGLAAAPELEDRIDLAMDELQRTGAFDRSVLCLASPTGSGYINYVMAETLEFLTRGDCAIVTLQYSLRPSFLSLDRADLGIEQNRAIMHAITGYLRGMPEDRRPRFVLFGESLGALTILDMYRHRGVSALDRDFVSGSLMLGTPAGSAFRRSWLLDPEKVDPEGAMAEVDSHAEYVALDDDTRERVRHVLLTHHDDPIPKFGPSLLVRQPAWLGESETRPAGVPRSTAWRPATTFVLTGIDLVNAMEVVPGDFTRRGHDYREDIPEFVRDAFRLRATPAQMEAIESRLRQRELAWARRRVVTEEVARAREAVLREVKAWGVSGETLDPGFILHSVADDAQALLGDALASVPSAERLRPSARRRRSGTLSDAGASA